MQTGNLSVCTRNWPLFKTTPRQSLKHLLHDPASQMNSNSNNSFHKESAPYVLHARTVTGTGGGPEKTIINTPRFLSEMGYQSNCLFLRPPNDPGFKSLRERAQHADTQLIEVDDQGKFSRRMVKQVINHARERNVTIWHAHDYKSNLLLSIIHI